MKIISAPQQSYAEIGQNSAVKFSYAVLTDEGLKELFYPIKCRDFFNECCLKQWTSNDYSIYSFHTNNVPVFDGDVYLICRNFPESRLDKLKQMLAEMLHEVVDYVDGAAIVKLHPLTHKYTYYISYITFLIRCVEQFDNCVDTSTFRGNELGYARAIERVWKRNPADLFDVFKKAFSIGYAGDTVQGTKNDVDTGTLHNCSGIVGTFSNANNTFRLWAEGNA